MSLWIKTNWLVKRIFPKYVWSIPNNEKKVFLTFDDGPTPEITEWVLAELRNYNAKATFFCIGDNVQKYPAIFQKVLAENHSIGNHTFNHLKGWKTPTKEYIKNTLLCQSQFTIHSSQFTTQHLHLEHFSFSFLIHTCRNPNTDFVQSKQWGCYQ